MSSNLVVRNAELSGTAVGGLNAKELSPIVKKAAQRLAGAQIEVLTPSGPLKINAEEIGLVVNQEKTISGAINLGEQDQLWKRPFKWIQSIISPRRVEVVVTIDDQKLAQVLAVRDPTQRLEPVEPRIAADEDGSIKAIEGVNGHGLDTKAVSQAVADAASLGKSPIRAVVSDVVLPPRFDLEAAKELALKVEKFTNATLSVTADDASATIPPKMLKRWVGSSPTDRGLTLDLDDKKMAEDLAKLLPEAGTPAVDASFKVLGKTPVVIPGENGKACCAPASEQLILQALAIPTVSDGNKGPINLPLRVVEPDRSVEEAKAMGVVEEIGSFTTRHPANQPRVANIHRIADMLQGKIIEPGKKLSINEVVGKRTLDKGFIPAGVIYEGSFTEDVGGGVSQFATTLFNAAFFAGLDIPEYQSHSIWLDRYPRGREATLSYPKPDLVIENKTPHAVLIWSTYDSTSITVSLYSTRSVVAEQTGQTEGPVGACTRVTTERTRTWLGDNRTKIDRFRATYRPEEGVAC